MVKARLGPFQEPFRGFLYSFYSDQTSSMTIPGKSANWLTTVVVNVNQGFQPHLRSFTSQIKDTKPFIYSKP